MTVPRTGREGREGGEEDHVEEGALLRSIDGELTGEERVRVEAHLSTCVRCARAREELASIASQVSGALDSAVGLPPRTPELTLRRLRPPARRRMRPWLAAASVLLLAAASVLAFPGGRAFALELLSRIVPGVRERAAAPFVPMVAPQPGPERVLVEFMPTERVLAVAFSARQDGGTLHMVSHAEASVVLRSATASAVTVLPGALRVDNTAAPAGEYRLLIPSTIDRVVVQVQGREVASLSREQLSAGARDVRLR